MHILALSLWFGSAPVRAEDPSPGPPPPQPRASARWFVGASLGSGVGSAWLGGTEGRHTGGSLTASPLRVGLVVSSRVVVELEARAQVWKETYESTNTDYYISWEGTPGAAWVWMAHVQFGTRIHPWPDDGFHIHPSFGAGHTDVISGSLVPGSPRGVGGGSAGSLGLAVGGEFTSRGRLAPSIELGGDLLVGPVRGGQVDAQLTLRGYGGRRAGAPPGA